MSSQQAFYLRSESALENFRTISRGVAMRFTGTICHDLPTRMASRADSCFCPAPCQAQFANSCWAVGGMRKRASRIRSRITDTAAMTSSKSSARSKRTFASTATSCGRFGLAAIVELHELFPKFFALRVGPLVARGPRPCGQHRAGSSLLAWRFLAFHAVTLPAFGLSFNPLYQF